MMNNRTAAIGVDFGGTTIKSAVIENGAVRARGSIIETRNFSDSAALLEAMVAEIANLKKEHSDVRALGVGLPGIVDTSSGIVRQLSNVAGWIDVPLRELLKTHCELPVAIENDAIAMTYAEWKFGAARGGKNVVCVTLGTGVGGGLILNGDLYRGSQLCAGEIGHMSIDYRGMPGNYGVFGALEKYVGHTQISERAQKQYAAGGQSFSLSELTLIQLATRARNGDQIAAALWHEVGTEIGVALANVIWLLNPDCIVIGGGVAKVGDLIFDPIRETIRSRTMPVFHERLQVVPASLGTDAGMIGAATVALENC